MKKLFIGLAILFSVTARAQSVRSSPTYSGANSNGYVPVINKTTGSVNKMRLDSLPGGGGGGSSAWGSIPGTLSSQTDLQAALDAKLNITDTAGMLSNYKHWTQGYLTNITGKVTAGTNVTRTGSGTTADPYVFSASGGTWGTIPGTLSDQTDLQAAFDAQLSKVNNLSDLPDKPTSRSNLRAAHDKFTVTDKSSAFAPALAEFTGLIPLYRCTADLTLTLPSDATVAIPVGVSFYGITMSGFTTTFAAGSGASVESSSGGYTATPGTGASFFFWSVTKRAANTWSIQNGGPAGVSVRDITFSAGALTHTNMPAGVQELSSSAYRFRTKADLTGYTQLRLVVGCSLAGSTNAGFYVQYSTDDATFVDIGTATGTNLAQIATAGTKVSDWINLPSGAKADVYLRVVSIGGDGVADPVTGLIQAKVK